MDWKAKAVACFRHHAALSPIITDDPLLPMAITAMKEPNKQSSELNRPNSNLNRGRQQTQQAKQRAEQERAEPE